MTLQEMMELAIVEAKKTGGSNDVPIGAVILKNGQIIGKGFNMVEKMDNPLKHAEIIAIEEALSFAGSKYLSGCDIVVNLEPCVMCSGAIVAARLDRLIFGAYDTKAGGSGSIYNITHDSKLNHQCEVYGGILEDKCSKMITDFFEKLRKK